MLQAPIRLWLILHTITACLLLIGTSSNLITNSNSTSKPTTTITEAYTTATAEAQFRSNTQHPSPRCCQGKACLSLNRGNKHAFLASLRSPGYIPLLRELHCSLQKSNPGVPLIVIGAEGDLEETAVSEIRALNNTRYQIVPDLEFPNRLSRRFSLNWIKLRAWEMEEYDAIIMLDVDMVVKGKVGQLFSLPTDFAWAPLQGPNWAHNAGGFVFLRPCKGVFEHMLDLLTANKQLEFPEQFAEQSFLRWYMGPAATQLPMAYNTNFDFVTVSQSGGLRTIGSEHHPIVIHFANIKPFTPTKGTWEWMFLCHAPLHPHHHRYQGHPVTFYAKCGHVDGFAIGAGQYATFGPGMPGNDTIVSGRQLREYRLYKAVSMIVVHRPYSSIETQLFDDPQCLGEPFYRGSEHRVCLQDLREDQFGLGVDKTTLANRVACIKIVQRMGRNKGLGQVKGRVVTVEGG
jgi:hypothetical protein